MKNKLFLPISLLVSFLVVSPTLCKKHHKKHKGGGTPLTTLIALAPEDKKLTAQKMLAVAMLAKVDLKEEKLKALKAAADLAQAEADKKAADAEVLRLQAESDGLGAAQKAEDAAKTKVFAEELAKLAVEAQKKVLDYEAKVLTTKMAAEKASAKVAILQSKLTKLGNNPSDAQVSAVVNTPILDTDPAVAAVTRPIQNEIDAVNAEESKLPTPAVLEQAIEDAKKEVVTVETIVADAQMAHKDLVEAQQEVVKTQSEVKAAEQVFSQEVENLETAQQNAQAAVTEMVKDIATVTPYDQPAAEELGKIEAEVKAVEEQKPITPENIENITVKEEETKPEEALTALQSLFAEEETPLTSSEILPGELTE